MEQNLSEIIYMEMVDEKSPKLDIIHRLYQRGPVVAAYEVAGWADLGSPDALYRTMESWAELRIVERCRVEGGVYGGAPGYRINGGIFRLVEDGFMRR